MERLFIGYFPPWRWCWCREELLSVNGCHKELLQTTNLCLTFFYCSRQDDTRDSHTILRSLVAQFCYSTDATSIPEPIWKRYEERSSKRTGGSLSIQDCEDLLVSLTRDRGPSTVVVNALDECPDYNILLESLKGIYIHSQNLKLFFSCRKMHLTAADYFCDYKPVVITVIN